MEANSAFEVFKNRRAFQPQHGGKRQRCATDFDLLRDSSANVSQEQVQLIAAQPQATKDVIYLAKALKDRFFKPAHVYLPSYVIEILVLKAMGTTHRFHVDHDSILYNVFEMLRDLDTELICVLTTRASQHGITNDEILSYWKGSKSMRSGALVIDPVNPLMNVAKMVDVEAVRDRSEALLARVWSED